MKKLFTILLAIGFLTDGSAQIVNRLVGASPFQDSLWVIDTSNVSVTRRLGPTPSSGGSITGINGIAKNPNSGTIYVIIKQSAVSGRVLGKFNVTTGVVSIVGNMGDNFSSLTFRGDSLLATTGDGATVPESLFLVDTTTGTPTLLTALGNGLDGEIICYNPTDDMIYHWSGNGTVVFEKFSPVAPYTVTPIATLTNETFGAVWISGNKFLRSNIGSSFNYVYASGTMLNNFGSTPDDLRGLIFISCDRTISGTAGFCPGGSTTLTAPANASSYQWYMDGNLMSGETNQTLVVSVVGDYSCKVNDNCGSGFSTAVTVVQFTLPTVSLSSASTSFCQGDSLLLTGSSGGTSQWYMNGTPISGANSNTYYATAAGWYNMTKTNLNGCSDSAAVGISVSVNSLPMVTVSGANSAFCEGDSTTLLGTTGGTYQWYLNGMIIAGANSDNYVADASGMYNMMLTDANGCSDTAAVGFAITVNPLPVVTAGASTNFVCVNGNAVTLTGNPVGGTFSGTAVTGSTFDPAAAVLGNNDVVYTYTDGNSCTNSDTTTIVVDECLSINEQPVSSITVYPNPVQHLLWINASASGNYSLTDVSGRVLITGTALKGLTSVDLSQVSAGVYTLTCTIDNQLFSESIVVTK